MALTPSTMLELGTKTPAFSLPDVVTGKTLSSSAAAGPRGLVVMFICNHCPFVKHIVTELGRLGSDALAKGIGVAAISSNDIATHPDDAPDKMKALATSQGWKFPYLYDESQSAAKAYRAACTPDFYVFDAGGSLVYRGQLDDSRPGNAIPVTGADVRAAVDAVAAGRPAAVDQKPSIGCNIKWKKGLEPAWFGAAK